MNRDTKASLAEAAVGSDTAQVDALNQRAWALRTADIAQTIELSQRARQTAVAQNYRWGEAKSLQTLSYCHLRLAEYELARTLAYEALTIFEEVDDRESQADSLNTIGNIHSSLGDHHTALEFYLQSLRIRQEIGHQQAEAASYNNIGNVYYHLTDYDNALECHQTSLNIKQKIGDTSGMAYSLHNIANVYKDLGDHAAALQKYTESLTIFREVENRYGEAGVLSSMGIIYKEQEEIEAALEHYYQSLVIERTMGNKHGEAESLLQIGQLYALYPHLAAPSAKQLPGGALDCLQQALTLAQKLNATELVFHAHHELSQLYEKAGDFARALAHYQAFHTAEKEIFNDTLSEKTKKLQIIHQVERSRQEAALKRQEAEILRLKNVELAVALAEADQQRQLAEEANRQKTELISIATHDLKNPLTAIISYIQIILLKTQEPAAVGHYAQIILANADRMLRLIKAVLESSAVESSDFALSMRPIDMASLARWVLKHNQPQAAEKSQKLHLTAEAGCVAVVDELWMREVLDNLVNNAIKYSPRKRNIWLTILKQASSIRILVKDEGLGLTTADKRKLFGKFERLSAQPTAGENSTGLGLSIVKKLVELHQGQVWAESDGVNQGSTFIVELPLAAADEI